MAELLYNRIMFSCVFALISIPQLVLWRLLTFVCNGFLFCLCIDGTRRTTTSVNLITQNLVRVTHIVNAACEI